MTLRHRSAHLAIMTIGYLASVLAYGRLLPTYRAWVAFLLPTAAAGIYTLLELIWKRDFIRPHDADTEATYGAIVLRILLFMVALHISVLVSAIVVQGPTREMAAMMSRVVPVMVGLALIGIGNLLPKLQPNLVIGIRTSRTLADRSIWRRTNRVAGYAAVLLGVVFLVGGGLMPHGTVKGLVLGFAGLVALTVVVVHAWMAAPCPN